MSKIIEQIQLKKTDGTEIMPKNSIYDVYMDYGSDITLASELTNINNNLNQKIEFIDTKLDNKADLASPALTGTPTAPTPISGAKDTQIATAAFVRSEIDSKLAANDAMLFKGTIGSSGATVTTLPATHNAGWTYRVITAGTYAGVSCEIGDMIICITDGTTANNAHWTVVQTNTDGIVIGPSSVTSGRIATFSGTTGKIIQDSGYTIATSVPANAKFTDTTYSNFVKSGSGAKAGLVPAPSTTAGTTKYLREDGTWAVPPDTNTTYTFNGAVSTIKDDNLTANRVLISNSSGKVAVSDITSTKLNYVSDVTSNIQAQLDTKANKTDIATTATLGVSNNAAIYAKISDFGTWGTGAWYQKGFSMLITSRGGETVWVSVSSDDSNTNAKAIRLLNTYGKILNLYYSVSESAIYVHANAWSNNINAHILSNVNGDYVPKVTQASALPSDAVQITITEFGPTGSVTAIGNSALGLALKGSATRPTYNSNDMALHSDVTALDTRLSAIETKAITVHSGAYTDMTADLGSDGDIFLITE